MRTVYFQAIIFVLLTTLALAAPSNAQAQNWPFGSRKKTQKNAELTRRDGPWLIMCASFVGDEGEQRAKMLANELQQKNLKVFIYRHRFDFSNSVAGIGWQKYKKSNGEFDKRPKSMKVSGQKVFDEIAVLVGSFPTVDDSRAQRTLEKIKSMDVPSMREFSRTDDEGQRLRVWREYAKRASSNSANKFKGPLGAAFLLANPMLPDEYFTSGGIDDFVLKMNRHVKHSLLKCPAPYSVRVATFRGATTFQLNEMAKEETKYRGFLKSRKPVKSSKLEIAAAKAHRLTHELRKAGVEAYEFHDRFESYVCVGSFDWIAKETRTGRQQNPDVVSLINSFKATVRNDVPWMPQGAVQPKVLPKLKKYDIAFDPQPLPVIVPKASTHTASRGGLFR